jgi:hypothetical protein
VRFSVCGQASAAVIDGATRPGWRCHFPGSPVIGKARSRPPQDRDRVGPLQFPRQPSDRSTSPTPEGSSARAPGLRAPSMAFAKSTQARHRTPCFPLPQSLDDAAHFASRCGPATCSIPLRPRPLNWTRRPH